MSAIKTSNNKPVKTVTVGSGAFGVPVTRVSRRHKTGIPQHRLGGIMTLVPEPQWIGAGRESPTSAAYVGLTETAALAAAHSARIAEVRVHDGLQPIHADLRPARLTLLVLDGYVSKAAFC